MVATQLHDPPIRVADLIGSKEQGKHVTCNTEFGVHQVEFRHLDAPYDAYLFFCYFSGQVDGKAYKFRKCYAKGCPETQCANVAQAVMIANRYLQRDLAVLRQAGIEVADALFSLPETLVDFKDSAQDQIPGASIEHFVELAAKGEKVDVKVMPEFMPAHENFGGRKEPQVFLVANFSIDCQGRTTEAQRCFSCFAAEKEVDQKSLALLVARQRMSQLYGEFDRAGVNYDSRFFD